MTRGGVNNVVQKRVRCNVDAFQYLRKCAVYLRHAYVAKQVQIDMVNLIPLFLL